MKHPSRTPATVAHVAALAWASVAVLACSPGSNDPSAAQDQRLGNPCTYPRGGYGTVPSEVPPPTLSWRGVSETGRAATISIADYHDCDGSRGIHALLVDQSSVWCGACQHLAQRISNNLRSSWGGRGIRVLTLLTENADRTPATIDTAATWKRHFELGDDAAVVADPERSFRDSPGQQMAPYPYQVLINPRTMEIVSVGAGYHGDSDFLLLLELAQENASR